MDGWIQGGKEGSTEEKKEKTVDGSMFREMECTTDPPRSQSCRGKGEGQC